MKKIPLKKIALMTAAIASFAMFSLWAPSVGASEKGPGIAWQSDFQALMAETTQADFKAEKPLLLRFTATWCPPCRVMNARVWPSPDVVEAVTKGFTPVEIDIDSPGGGAMADRFKVIGVPSIIILDRSGKEVARSNFMSAEETLTFLKQADEK